MGVSNGPFKIYEDVSKAPTIMPYKGTDAIDSGAFYCPYVPLSVFGGTSYYWYASKLIEDTHPIVVIDGHYRDSNGDSFVRDHIERWFPKNAKGGFYWHVNSGCCGERFVQCDVLHFTDMEDAILFKLTFSAKQYFRYP